FDNHGTAVAGIIGAVGNNSLGVSGAAQSVRILPVKIARDDDGLGGGFISSPMIAKAVYYAAGIIIDQNGNPTGNTWRGADIINDSWGGGASDQMLTNAFSYIATHGRNGLGVPAFNATGNSAAGIPNAPGYSTVTVNILTARSYKFRWR